MLELYEMWSIPILPLLPGPLWTGVVAPERVLELFKIELFDHLTVIEQISDV